MKQKLRTQSILFFDSTTVLVIRIFSHFLGAVSLLLIIAALFFELSPAVIGLAVLFTTPSVLFLGYGWYINFLKVNPSYGLTSRDLELPENRLDFAVWEAVLAMQKGGWSGFWRRISRDVNALEVLLRLQLSEAKLIELFESKVSNGDQSSRLIREVGQTINAGSVGTVFDLLSITLRHQEFAPHFTALKISPEEVEQLIEYYRDRHARFRARQLFWLHPEQARTGGFAAGWALSYTSTLDRFTEEVTPSIKFHTEQTPLFSRSSVVDLVISELQKQSNHNVLLVGEEGSGRKEIFYHVADKLLHYQSNTPLDGIQVRLLDTARLVAATDSVEHLQQLLDQIFTEISRSGRIVLFIDQLESLLSDNSVGAVNLSQVLAKYLQDERIHIVATIQTKTYVTQVKPDATLASIWAKIDIAPPPSADLPLIILSHIVRIENRYDVFFSYTALRAVTQLSGQYLTDLPSPERELMITEEVAARNHGENSRVVEPSAVTKVIEQKSGVTIEVGESEKVKLQDLPNILHQRVIGQDEAIQAVSDALLRARAGIGTGKKPLGTFLFLGPTGVGKTETARTLAQMYFGSPDKLIQLDMTEYGAEDGLQKLLGTDVVSQPGTLTVALEKNPSAVLLFDEFEKAHQLVQNTLLQILDEGRLTTNFGKVLRFTNTIIIATSNAGSNFIKQQVESGQTVKAFSKQLIDQLIAERVFTPELLNRFDTVAVYSPLSASQIEAIAKLRINETLQSIEREKGITVRVSDAVITEIAKKGYDPVFGARALSRVIKSELETQIARKIISESPQPGATLTIDSLSK